jgi:succinate dehydrogenase / fumarate reductase iron-sulfur subunit
VDIGMATDCVACGCCVSSCTMVNNHEGYAGPAALNRAFTLLADTRDALFAPRLARALDSCYNCRTEFNCTEVCPKKISGTYAIKYIQRMALTRLPLLRPLPQHPAELAPPKHAPHARELHGAHPRGDDGLSRRSFLTSAAGLVGIGTLASLTSILGVASIAPTLQSAPAQWVAAGPLSAFPVGSIGSAVLRYARARAFHSETVSLPVLVRRDSETDLVCFSDSCPHLGCAVSWDNATERFKCACHGGPFDRYGNVLAAPPPRPLTRLPWKTEAGILKVEVA